MAGVGREGSRNCDGKEGGRRGGEWRTNGGVSLPE